MKLKTIYIGLFVASALFFVGSMVASAYAELASTIAMTVGAGLLIGGTVVQTMERQRRHIPTSMVTIMLTLVLTACAVFSWF